MSFGRNNAVGVGLPLVGRLSYVEHSPRDGTATSAGPTQGTVAVMRRECVMRPLP